MTQAESGELDHSKEVAFSSDAQLLAELGERLIAFPEIAIGEILKNSYDADATEAYVWAEGGDDPKLTIKDNGHGMTEEDFLAFWMKIGTTSKLVRTNSPVFGRPLTGSKGVGRFAARRLGDHLTLTTTATAADGQFKRVVAVFDWKSFNAGTPLTEVKVGYDVRRGFKKHDMGTTLEIRKLRDDVDEDGLPGVTREVLDIVNPPLLGPSTQSSPGSKEDPGLSIFFGRPGDKHTPQASAGEEIVDRWVARVTFQVKGPKVTYKLWYRKPGDEDSRREQNWTVKLPGDHGNLVGDVLGEVRFLPKREGVFGGMETLDGRRAVGFLREKGGVRVYDRGFRIPPYGGPFDDWLQLSARVAQHTREWGSKITETLYPASKRSTQEAEDPLLKVPGNRQLIGSVHVTSFRPGDPGLGDHVSKVLQPAMDREGFLSNDGFSQLVEVTKAAVNFIAVVDVEELVSIDEEKAKEATHEAHKSIAKAIKRIRLSKEIPTKERASLVRSLQEVDAQVAVSAEKQQESIRSIESMSLLGILAGFMTHETSAMLRSVNDALAALDEVGKESSVAAVREARETLHEARQRMQTYMDYTRTFLLQAPEDSHQQFKVRPQLERIEELFKNVGARGRVKVQYGMSYKTMSPETSLGVYAGTALNLFTNALKAVLKVDDKKRPRIIRFDVDDTPEDHVLSISDTGVGIPPELQDLIFEPFVTTTKEEEGPLAGGMGLGLYIVRRVLTSVGGRIRLVSPRENFTTTFEVTFPKKGG